MILVAESGSTKTQWCVVYPDRIEHLENTSGINPVFLTGEEIEGIIRPVSAGIDTTSIEAVYFFGAGCNSIASKEKIGKAIFSVLEPPEIIIDSDLIAACLALAGEKPAMIGILGTGSNSCLWNGSEVEEKNPSLGYILGDEGSGVSIGKQLVADFLKKQMPIDVHLKFSETYDVSVENVIERVYQLPLPNRYLAGFAPFIENNIENTYCRELLIGQFERYIIRNFLSYSNANTTKIHFCGSIASIHSEFLIQVCSRYGLTVGKIVKEPINDLADFLCRKIYQIE